MRRHLRDVLARQWLAFGLLLFAGLAAMALLLLFLLEDAFIDRRLREVGEGLAQGNVTLPSRFERHARDAVPTDLREGIAGQRDGVVREFRLADGRYVHVLADTDRTGAPFVLVYDVSDQLHVNMALQRAWPWLLVIGVVLGVAAWSFARRFVAQVTSRADALVRALGQAEDPGELDAMAQREDVAEFADLARLGAQAWRQRLQAVASEHESLAFLAHELRTPLQSARTSLALLKETPGDDAAWQRLQRAQDRLTRASQAILWLAGDAELPSGTRCRVADLLAALAAAFAPLARARGQGIRIEVSDALTWQMPTEIAESALANVLHNAIQHGAAGTIVARADADAVIVENAVAADGDRRGFGLGLRIAERLMQRCGGRLVASADEAGTWRVRLEPAPH